MKLKYLILPFKTACLAGLVILFSSCGSGDNSNYPLRLSEGSPSSSLPAGTHSTTLSLVTNIDATCKYSYSENVEFSRMEYEFEHTGGQFHSQVISGLTDGIDYAIYIRCSDYSNNASGSDYVISFSVNSEQEDITSPEIQSLVISENPFSIDIQLSTNEPTTAIIDYGITNQYGLQKISQLSNSHSINIPNLALNTEYNLQVTIHDVAGNETKSGNIVFSTLTKSGGVAGGNDSSPIEENTPPENYIDLTLDARYSIERAPIRTGIPFAYGVLKSLDHLRLEDSAGKEIPAQYNALANWPDGSIKSVLIQFLTNTSTSAQSLKLAYGDSISRASNNTILATTQANGVAVDTGVIRLILDGNGNISSLWRDNNNDRLFTDNEKIITQSELFASNAFNGIEYNSSQSTDSQIVIEESGPIRAVIKATGSMASTNNETLIKYLIRYYVYFNSDKIDIEYTVIDDRPETDVHKAEDYRNPTTLALSISDYGFRMNYLNSGLTQYRFGGEAGDVYSGTVSNEHYLLQQGEFVYDNGADSHTFNYSGVGSGERAPGWMALDSGNKHIAVAVKEFWQQFPNEISVTDQSLTVSLHPKRSISTDPDTMPLIQGAGGTTKYVRPNTFYFTREGGAKTYQIRLIFPSSTPDNSSLQNENNLFQSNDLLLKATPAWYTATGVFGDLDVGTSTSSDIGFDAHMMRDYFEPSMVEEKQATNFGWRDYGDRLRAGWSNTINGVRIPGFYNDTHVGATNFFKMFIRTGDQRWYNLAQVSTRHFMDIDVSHTARQGYWNGFGTPMQPPGEIHAIKHDMVDHTARNVHPGHAHASGLVDYYLLTGDKRAKEVMHEIAGWWKFITPYMYPLPFDFDAPNNRGGYREATRDYGWPLFVMNEYVRLTGDADYHRETSAHLVKYLIAWWQTRKERIGYDAETDTLSNEPIGKFNDASQGTGFWTMTRAGNYGAYNRANGMSPWMAGSLIGNIIEFYERDKEFNAVANGSGISHAVLKDMLFQAINYVVKNGYDAENDRFVYSETIRNYGGGRTHIIFPLAYLTRLYNEENSKNNILHPEWYDKRNLWEVIAIDTYNDYMSKEARQYTQSYGWYGYEIPHPLDFFKIASELVQ